MTRWITADWHLGENRFKIMQRYGFDSADHMVDELVSRHNDLVGDEDIVYVVGDACNLNTPEYLPEVARFKGKKILIRGNHDRVFSDEQLLEYFEAVLPDGDGIEISAGPDKLKCWVTHYPTQSRTDCFNLVGHIHTAWKVLPNALNVGVDCNHYRPHDLDVDIPFYFEAICKHYDDDVWAAYHDSQSEYHHHKEGCPKFLYQTRGKPGRYLDKEGLVGGGK